MADSDAVSSPVHSGKYLRRAALLLPPLVLAALLAAWGVDLPYWDQFALVPHLAERAAGTFHYADLWTPHNEHRLLVPQAIMMVLASWSGWNILWELWFQYGLAVATLVLVLALLRPTRGGSETPVGVVLVVSLMVFSPVQWRNWIWGWQSQIFLAVLAAVAVVWLLTRVRTPWLRVGSASLVAAVGSISFANGLLIWPLALPLVAFGGHAADDPDIESDSESDEPDSDRPAWRPALIGALVWALVGAVVWAAYFHGFTPGVDDGPGDQGWFRQLLHFGAYVVLYLAAPVLRFHDQTALWGGFVLVSAGLLAMLWSGLRAACSRDLGAIRRGLPWWTLAAFAVASATVTALGRFDLGIGQALSSRYVTIADLFWLGLVGWLVTRSPSHTPLPRSSEALPVSWTRAAGAVFVALLLVNAAHGVYHFERDAGARRDLRRQILAAESPEELRALPLQFIHPSPEAAAQHFETLQELGLGPYR